MREDPAVVLFGRDELLLTTRAWILQKAGFAAEPTRTLAEVKRCFAARQCRVLVLCHSLSEAEKQAAVSLAASFQPPVRMLALERHPMTSFVSQDTQVMHVEARPPEFCLAVQSLLDATELSTPTNKEGTRRDQLEGTVTWFNHAEGRGFPPAAMGRGDAFAHTDPTQDDAAGR